MSSILALWSNWKETVVRPLIWHEALYTASSIYLELLTALCVLFTNFDCSVCGWLYYYTLFRITVTPVIRLLLWYNIMVFHFVSISQLKKIITKSQINLLCGNSTFDKRKFLIFKEQAHFWIIAIKWFQNSKMRADADSTIFIFKQ